MRPRPKPVFEEDIIADYTIDPVISRFTVRGFATGLLAAMGHNPVIGIRNIAGEVRFDPEAPQECSLRMKIPAASLEVQNNASDKDRREMKRAMDEEVLETARYPEILFESDGVTLNDGGNGSYRAAIQGALTLHGVTRPLQMPAQVSVMGAMLRANGEFSVSLSEYRIKPPSAVGGAIKLKDQIRLSFEIVANRQTESVKVAGQGESNVPGNPG